MKKKYIRPIVEIICTDSQGALLIGSDNDHADAPPMDDIFDDGEEVNEYPDLKHKNYWID